MHASARHLTTAFMATTALAAVGVSAQAAAPPVTTSGSTNVEELVVTASKRSEAVKDVPSGITALGGSQLEKLQVVDFNDYVALVPGLSENGGLFGLSGQYAVIIRGIDSGAGQTTPTVGYYLDEIPVTPNAAASVFGFYAPDPDLEDVDHIEVLKGPQGTLYGANTLGGLIKIVSRKPNLSTFQGEVASGLIASDPGGTGYLVRGDASMPIIGDRLAASFSLYDRYTPGFINNLGTGDRDYNWDHAYGGRLTIRWDPTPRLDIEAMGLIQFDNYKGQTNELIDPVTLKSAFGDYNTSHVTDGRGYNSLALAGVTATYETDFGTITDAASFSRVEGLFSDYDDTYIYGAFVPHGTAVIADDFRPRDKKWTEELRFSSKRFGRFEGQAGFYFTDEKVFYPGGLILERLPGLAVLPSPPNPLFFGVINGTYREYAGFGDLTFYLLPNLDVTGGVRYSRNNQLTEVLTTGLLFHFVTSDKFQNFSASDTNYLFTARWRPTSDLSLYVRAASGYRPGGPEIVPAPGFPNHFGPDTTWDYEVGAKGSWLGGRVTADFDVYYIDWRNIQLNSTIGGFIVSGNGGNARSDGFEFQGTVQPVRGLVIAGNLAYTDARMTSAIASNTAGARVGDPLPFTPSWAGAVSADYSFPLSQSLTASFGGTVAYEGDRNSSFSGSLLNPNVVMPNYTTLAVRGRIDWRNYALSLNIDNVTDVHTYTFVGFNKVIPGQVVDANGTVLRPRTYRLTLSAKF